MRRFICLIFISVLLLSSCSSIVDTALDKSVKEMFIALSESDTEKADSMMRKEHEDFASIEIKGEFASCLVLNRNTETVNGVTTKDARYQFTTSVDVKYVVMVRYIIDENAEGFFQYLVAEKDY